MHARVYVELMREGEVASCDLECVMRVCACLRRRRDGSFAAGSLGTYTALACIYACVVV
jgi:hypothetical protein